ncbi:MAG: hypothetical protein AB8G77_06125 [Rhodothermales bacterium]
MGKQPKSGRASKKNLSQNAAWFEERLESDMLDLESLASMSIDDVNAELKKFKPKQKAFVESLNAKLPAGASIPVPKAPARKPRRTTQATKAGDRQASAATPSVTRRSSRIFGLKSALFLSVLIIASAVLVPKLIRDYRADKLETVTAIEKEVPQDTNKPPTWIEGPAVDELVRGVRYTIQGLEQVVLRAPLPTNPGDLTANFKLRMTVDSNGKVTGLEPLSVDSSDFEPTVIDSLLQWKFSALANSDQLTEAVVTIRYIPE